MCETIDFLEKYSLEILERTKLIKLFKRKNRGKRRNPSIFVYFFNETRFIHAREFFLNHAVNEAKKIDINLLF